MVELTADDLNYLSEFQKLTSIYPLDYMNTELALLFLVENKGELYKALGKKGVNLIQLSKKFGKSVFIILSSSDLKDMIRNCFHSLQNMDIKVEERGEGTQVTLIVGEEDKGIAIGRGGARIKAVKELLKKKFNVTNFQLRTTKRFSGNEGGVEIEEPSAPVDEQQV